METEENMLNVKETARRCGRNMETVRRWVWGGKLPARKLGNQLFIKEKDLVLFCREAAILLYDAGTKTGINHEPEDILNKKRGKPMNTIDTEKKDFLERAISFRKRLRARGYPSVDAVALVKKSRSGRMRELRQGLY